jgi:hypothetical protein
MPLKLRKITKAWFTHKESESEFEIKYLLVGEINEITEKCSESGIRFSEDGETIRGLSRNRSKNQEMTICKSIVAWKNILDVNGEDLECTEENKIRFCREQYQEDFDDFIEDFVEWRKTLSEKIEEQKEESEKN